MKNRDMPAMPSMPEDIADFGAFYDTGMCGLTKLEHFAGLAMQSLYCLEGVEMSMDQVAEHSVAMAKALLEELEAQK